MTRAAACVLALALILVACTHRDAAPASTATPLPSPVSAAPDPHDSGTPSPELLARLKQIEQRVTVERGLAADKEPPRRFLSRKELEDYYARSIQRSSGEGKLAITQEVLQLLGAIGKDVDLGKAYAQFYSENILGFFDTGTGELVVVADPSRFGPSDEVTYAHEFTHALQQQHFDINGLNKKLEDDSEASAGLTALIEGDATLSMSRYMFRYLSPAEIARATRDSGQVGAKGSSFLVDEMLFPYREGLQFVLDLFRSGGWGAVNAAFARPPTTTEQVMHPEKYRQHEGAAPVTLPDVKGALGEGWEQRDSGAIGEFDLKELLKLHISEAGAAQAAAGWGGDRYVYLRGPGGGQALAASIAWDTAQDAREFFDAYSQWLRAQDLRVQRTASRITWSWGGRSGVLDLQDKRTILVLASDDQTRERALSAFALG